MSRKYEVTAITGKYTDSSGQEKSRYQTIGAVIESRNGLMLKLEAVPIGWDGWAYLNKPKPKDGQAPRQQSTARPAPRPSHDYDDGGPPF
jgi:hypothetical protein